MDQQDPSGSIYGPSQEQTTLNPWRQRMPFSMDPGSTYQGPNQAALSSMFAPSQGSQPAQPQQPATPQTPPTPYMFGDTGGDGTAQENKANADRIGQGVLAASQAAASKQGGGMKKKKPGAGDQGGSGGDSGGGDYGGTAGMGGF